LSDNMYFISGGRPPGPLPQENYMWKLSSYADHCMDTAIENVRLCLQRWHT